MVSAKDLKRIIKKIRAVATTPDLGGIESIRLDIEILRRGFLAIENQKVVRILDDCLEVLRKAVELFELPTERGKVIAYVTKPELEFPEYIIKTPPGRAWISEYEIKKREEDLIRELRIKLLIVKSALEKAIEYV